ncbi:MAG: peroxiredoxin [Bacteroidota bacterium]|nr:peroxiredoxin [Bacteroidota bacterium]
MKNIAVGDLIPSFVLEDQKGKIFDTKDYVGKNKMIIYFYPKDESAVCTKEACAFRDSFSEFTDAGAVVVGINSGSVTSHNDFALKNRLPFQLLSDPGNKVLKQFGIKPWLFLTGRETFVIGLDGKVAFKYRAFLDGSSHSEAVTQFLNQG